MMAAHPGRVALIEAGSPGLNIYTGVAMGRGIPILATVVRDAGYDVRAFIEDVSGQGIRRLGLGPRGLRDRLLGDHLHHAENRQAHRARPGRESSRIHPPGRTRAHVRPRAEASPTAPISS